MKKGLVILLLLVYGFSVSGMAINLHYCCGKLKSVDLSATAKNCGGDHKMGSKRCCENKQISNKEKSDQEHLLLLAKQIKLVPDAVQPFSVVTIGRSIQPQLSPVAFAPPPLSPTPLFVLHCVYRI